MVNRSLMAAQTFTESALLVQPNMECFADCVLVLYFTNTSSSASIEIYNPLRKSFPTIDAPFRNANNTLSSFTKIHMYICKCQVVYRTTWQSGGL